MINCPRAVVLQDCRQSCLNLICFLASSEKEHIFSVIPFVKQKQLKVIKRFSILIFLFNPTLAWKGLAGCGLVVRVLAIYLDNLRSNPVEVYFLFCTLHQNIENKGKRGWKWPFKNISTEIFQRTPQDGLPHSKIGTFNHTHPFF